jgi:hypothetical protein
LLSGVLCGAGAGGVHAVGELLKLDGGGAQGRGAVAAHLRNDFIVEIADEAANLLLGTLGGVVEALIEVLRSSAVGAVGVGILDGTHGRTSLGQDEAIVHGGGGGGAGSRARGADVPLR